MTHPDAPPRPAAAHRAPEGGAIQCDGLVRIYKRRDVEVQALQGLDLTVESGEIVAIVGASGSGKSTLLNILSGLDRPAAGSATVAGHDLLAMGRRQRRHYRRHTCGFVWQQASRNLLPFLTASENVQLPARLAGEPGPRRAARARELLELLGIPECAEQRPTQMSSGQQQRLSIAVAVVNGPRVLFCDEPTGELDTAAAHGVFAALRATNEALGTTCLVVTHDHAVTDEVGRTVAIRNGRIVTETLRHASGTGRVSEYAVLDRVGRLQLPEDFVEALHLQHRVRLELEPDHIGVWPPASPTGDGDQAGNDPEDQPS